MSFTDIPKGIVLVGGGSNLRGFSDALSRMTHTPVRMGTIPASVRVTDPRMQSLEMLDVIAILKAAADNSPMECTETPEYAGTPERSGGGDYVPVDDDGPGPQPRRQQRTAPAKPVKKQRRQSDEDDDSEVESKPGFFSRMVGKLSGFFDEPEDQEN
jgi:cell division ATPase FtsA